MDAVETLFMTMKEAPITDYEIVLDVLSGNRNAYRQLIEKYEGKVRGSCLVMLSDPSEAEDAAQEVFIKAYQALGQFRGDAAFGTWIYRITTNHCLSLLRKRKRHPVESWEALIEKDGDKIESLLSVEPSRGSADETTELIGRLLAHLSEDARKMLILREVQGFSYQEICDTLGCSLDSVKSKLRRTRQELEKKMRHLLTDTRV